MCCRRSPVAGLDRAIDPLTQDYEDADGGEYAETRTLATAFYHQLRTERNRFWGDPEAGSELYLVRTMGVRQSTVLFIEDTIRTALQPFIEAGLASDLEVEVEGTESGRHIIEASITDRQGGRVDLSDIAPVGEV
jgi:phage gp46-like protein